LPDADIDMAADAAVSAAYGSAGERCMAVSVVVAVGEVADPLIDAIKTRLPIVKVVPGLESDSELGPLITREHRDKVAGYLDGGVASQFQCDAQAGMVGVNVPIPVPVAYYSFGGWKASLFGDRHIYGPEGVDFYTRGKVVTSRWPDPATSKVDLGFPQTR